MINKRGLENMENSNPFGEELAHLYNFVPYIVIYIYI